MIYLSNILYSWATLTQIFEKKIEVVKMSKMSKFINIIKLFIHIRYTRKNYEIPILIKIFPIFTTNFYV